LKNISLYLSAYFAVAALSICDRCAVFGVGDAALGLFLGPPRALDTAPAERRQDGNDGGQRRSAPRLKARNHAIWPPAF